MLNINADNAAKLDRLAASAINHWGVRKQIDQTVEECSELLCELTKFHRDRQDWEHIKEEVADVTVMMAEMIKIIGPEEFNRVLAVKLNKFEAGLSKSIQAKVDQILSIHI